MSDVIINKTLDGMTNRNHGWSVLGLLLFLLVIYLAEALQGFSILGPQEITLNSQEVEVAGYKTPNEGRKQESDEHPDSTEVSLGYASRRRRNIVDDAKQTVKSTTEKLTWVKKNFRYLLLMVGSIFFLFFSCAAYRRLTRDRNDEYGDDIKVVVIGGPQEKSPATGTTSNSPVSTTKKETKKTSKPNKTKKSSKPMTKVTKKNENAKATRMKGESKRAEPQQTLKEIESNTRNAYSDDADDCDTSDSDYNLDVLVCEYSDVIFSDLNNTCAGVKSENELKRSKKILFNALLNQKKKPFPQMKIDAYVINEGIPLSSYTSFQQIYQSEAELKVCEPTTQYVDEIRERAEILYGKRQVTHSTTSYSQYPVLDDLELNKRLVASILERCSHYHPMAFTNTRLPVTATAE